MIFRSFEDDETGEAGIELNVEGIDYLIAGLEELRECAPGSERRTPSFTHDDDGSFKAATFFVLLRAADE